MPEAHELSVYFVTVIRPMIYSIQASSAEEAAQKGAEYDVKINGFATMSSEVIRVEKRADVASAIPGN